MLPPKNPIASVAASVAASVSLDTPAAFAPSSVVAARESASEVAFVSFASPGRLGLLVEMVFQLFSLKALQKPDGLWAETKENIGGMDTK